MSFFTLANAPQVRVFSLWRERLEAEQPLQQGSLPVTPKTPAEGADKGAGDGSGLGEEEVEN